MENKTEIIIGEDQFLIKQSIDQILNKKFKIKNPIIEIIDLANQQKDTWKHKLFFNTFWDNQIFIIKHVEAYLKWKKSERMVFEKNIEKNPIYKILIWYGNEKSTIGKLKFAGKKNVLKKVTKANKYKFVLNFINENKIELLGPQILIKICDQMPNDLEIVHNNLLKIKALYHQKQQPLQIEEIMRVLNKYSQKKVFDLIEKIICRENLHQLLQELKNIPSEEQNIMFFLKLLNLYATGIINVKALFNSGMNLQKISNKIGKHIFLVRKFYKLISLTENSWLIHILKKVEEWLFKSRALKAKKNDIIEFIFIEIYEKK